MDAARGAGARGGQLAVRVRQRLQAGGRDAEGEGDVFAEDDGAGGGAGDVAEDARAEPVFGVGGGVFVDGDLVGGAGVEEVW